MAGDAGGGLGAAGLDHGRRRTRSARLGHALEAREIGGHVRDVLIREGRGLRLHRLVGTRAAPITL